MEENKTISITSKEVAEIISKNIKKVLKPILNNLTLDSFGISGEVNGLPFSIQSEYDKDDGVMVYAVNINGEPAYYDRYSYFDFGRMAEGIEKVLDKQDLQVDYKNGNEMPF